MTRAEYLALAERAEKAAAPDFALGVEILRACGRNIGAVNPLFSLDAALSLVPEGRIVRLLMDPDGRTAAYVNHPSQIADRRLAATPALALVAAALRARAEEAKDG